MKTASRIMAGLMMASLVMAGFSMAASSGTANRHATVQTEVSSSDMGQHRGDNGPIRLLGKFEFENIAAQTISELSSQPIETITAKLKDSRLPKVLSEYNITKEAFQTAMKPKFVALVQKRVDDGSITADQQTLILETLEKQGSRHALMEKLIQNGVTAGIVTQEEADKMLVHGEEEPPAE